jgi:ABC-2 type transport system permease protein
MPDQIAAGIGHLLAPKWRIARARARGSSTAKSFRERANRTGSLLLLGGLFWWGLYALASKMLRYFKGAEDIGTTLAGKLLGMILLALGSILLLSNVIGALSSFFLSRDLDTLAAAPIKWRNLYGAKFLETMLHSSWMVALLAIPILAAYGVVFEGGIGYALVGLAAMLPFLAIPTAIGSATTLALVTVFPARRTRDLLSFISVFAGAGVVVLFRLARPERLVKPEGFKNLVDFIAALDAPAAPWLPSEWVREVLMTWVRGGWPWMGLAKLWGAASLLTLIGALAHRRFYPIAYSKAQEGATLIGGGAQRTPSLLDRWLARMTPQRAQLVGKEIRVFFRDSTQWSQLVLLAVLVVVYVANVRFLPLSGEGITQLLRNIIPFVNLALAGFVLASIAARFVFPSVSLEGRTWWLIRAAPLSMRELLWSKFRVGIVPLLTLALIIVAATNWLLDVSPFVFAVSLIAIIPLTIALTAMALSFGVFYPQFDTENAAQIPTSFGGLLYMMSAITLIGAVSVLAARPAYRYVLTTTLGWGQTTAVDLIPPFLGAVLLCATATVAPLMLARRRLELIERA